ncbi:hypothetical protein ACP70R_015192 [Stipagrostis hirtigluma subsp. patula]
MAERILRHLAGQDASSVGTTLAMVLHNGMGLPVLRHS